LSVEQQLAAALAECERLRAENQQLRERQGLSQVETVAQSTDDTPEFNGD
jgi:regulator of replication initiation timing